MFVVFLLSAMLSQTVAFRGKTINDLFTVNSGVTTANCSLSLPVMDGDKTNISASSNMTADSALVNTYTQGTGGAKDVVNITGLDDTVTRQLTITYLTNQLGSFPGVDIAAKIWPLYIVLALLAAITGGIVYAFRHGD